jgi:ABC-type uncharacterized transport system substrate-binding protein
MQTLRFLTLLVLLAASFGASAASPYAGKKVLFIDSYHDEYSWSAELAIGIKGVLTPEIVKAAPDEESEKREPTGIELRILHLDTKRNPSEEFKQQAALSAKAEIEAFRPDVVIACDDNASKYLVMPFYKDADLPFVFCGVNWDASVYGYPYANVTGMIEIDLVDQILKNLKTYARGERIGFIGADNESERQTMKNQRKVFGIDFAQTYFPADFAAWKADFSRAQDEVDMLIIGSHVGIEGWNEAKAVAFAEANTRIPVGTPNDWEMPYALLGITKVAQEQGIWAAQTALKILGGAKPSEIPVTANEQGHLILNLSLADKLGVAFKPGMLKLAEIIR